MENVRVADFLSVGYGYGTGDGTGYGTGDGYGSGTGDGYGSGSGTGYGSGTGSGYGSGSGYGYGYGTGDGSGTGSGTGYGTGDGYGSGVKSINGCTVCMIDGVSTIIDQVHGSVAKGRILMDDLSTKPCYVAKVDNCFAHGDTLRDAMQAAREKAFDDMPEEDRIAAFVEAHDAETAYPNTDFWDWHHRLTGSCLAGRKAFAQNHGVDLDGSMTVMEFIRLTEHDYGGDTISKLRDYYEEAANG